MICPFCDAPDFEVGYHYCPAVSTDRVKVYFCRMDDQVAEAEKRRTERSWR